jgi:hypothetical protein
MAILVSTNLFHIASMEQKSSDMVMVVFARIHGCICLALASFSSSL